MCTGNVYCDQISTSAVEIIALYLNVLPEVIENIAHDFVHSDNEYYWHELVAEQNFDPTHPQTAYRELLKINKLNFNEGHAVSDLEFCLSQRFSRN